MYSSAESSYYEAPVCTTVPHLHIMRPQYVQQQVARPNEKVCGFSIALAQSGKSAFRLRYLRPSVFPPPCIDSAPDGQFFVKFDVEDLHSNMKTKSKFG